jgi:prepilin-type N-terminal cleavage/methylation domain-containing protein
MRNNKNKGFTLIELLVVIAIIGILSAVVLASLNSARDKGADTAIKANLANLRSQAAIYYDNNADSYDDGVNAVCDVDVVGGPKSLTEGINAAKVAGGILTATTRDAIGSAGTATCNDTATGWVAQVPLKTAGFYCVDSTGASIINADSSGLGAVDDVTCS